MSDHSEPSILDRIIAAGRATGLNRGLVGYAMELVRASRAGKRAVAQITRDRPYATGRAALLERAADMAEAACALPTGRDHDRARRDGQRMASYFVHEASGMNRAVGQATPCELDEAWEATRHEIDAAFRTWAETAPDPLRTLRELADDDPYIHDRYKKLHFDRDL